MVGRPQDSDFTMVEKEQAISPIDVDGVVAEGGDETKPSSVSDSDPEAAAANQKPAAAGAADGQITEETWDWDADPANPYNWPGWKKALQVLSISSSAFVASIGTSIVSPAHQQLMDEFHVSSTVAILPLSFYVLALALGPVVGGPLSETIGRHNIFLISNPLGALFTLGAGFSQNIGALSVCRFLAGFFFAPSLAVSSGVLNETFRPVDRALPSTIFILTPFLGPGLGPVIGSFVANRMGWRWTQWTLIFFAIFAMVCTWFGTETYHPVLKRRRAKQLGLPVPPKPKAMEVLRVFATIALIRPLHMLVAEPIVTFVCLYVACEFATLFSFFAGVPFVFGRVYHFQIEDVGLVFLSIVVGCLLGALTIMLCNKFLYLPKVPHYPPHRIPPEYRLYPAMLGSFGLPIGLFWFAWTARPDISWASPVVAIVPFAWGNLCLFISTIQYTADVYLGSTVASATSANSLARYGLAAVFPLFTIQMYTNLGIAWASSLLGFIAILLFPVPWALFKWGKNLRAMSKYETVKY